MTGRDDAQLRFNKAKDLIDRSRHGLAEGHRLMRELAREVTNDRARGSINQQIWDCEFLTGNRTGFFSQAGQDAFLDEKVFDGKRGGVFVEIGGYDGITGSNCLFFELMRGWTGLIVEPSPVYHAKCASFRRAPCLQLAVGAKTGKAEFLEVTGGMRQMSGLVDSYNPDIRAKVEADPRHKGDVIEVEVKPLAGILDEHGLAEIDYISLDVEGAEMDVLKGFPFERFRITALTVENNAASLEVPQFLASKGFRRVEVLGVDDVYLYDPGHFSNG
ncbi:FkbM family methyltransferase [Rhodobacteraceae bacterium NNCM2]|nr:FkbM family methyltransferase [Coraliihabitans acroporae]